MRWMWPGLVLGLAGCPAGTQSAPALETRAPVPETPELLEVQSLAAKLPEVPLEGLVGLGQALARQVATGTAAMWPGLGLFELRVHPPQNGLSDFRLFRLKLAGKAQQVVNPRKLVRPVSGGDEGWAAEHGALVLQLAEAIVESLPTGGISLPGIGVFVVTGRPAPEGGGSIKTVSFRPNPSLLEPLHEGHAKAELAVVLSREFYEREVRRQRG